MTGSGSGLREAVPPPEALRAGLADSAAAVRRYLFGMCGDWEQAEDIAQEALLKAWSRREGFDGRSSVRTWLFTIARNSWLDRLRRKKTALQETSLEQAYDIAASSGHSPATAASHRELSAAIHGAMMRLPAEQREALALRESEAMTFEQIAGLLGVPTATVKSRVRYALLKLGEDLKDFKE